MFNKKESEYFREVDPFNPKNEVEGFISRTSNEYYGALLVTKINNREIPEQIIMGTPKMHYPFVSREDGTRGYVFTSAEKIEVYEKLDGTNILAFSYSDGKNKYFSFKTRLRPFLNPASKWGNFYEMWKEVALDKFDTIRRIMLEKDCNLSFELYGARNPHLVLYSIPLDFALLFGVNNSGDILSLSELPNTEELKPLSILKTIDKDYVFNYEQLQKELNKSLIQLEDEKYQGREGTVWYLKNKNGKYLQYKCKPETIEAIHMNAGMKVINKQTIFATCWNALENIDEITVEFIKTLLLEEFKPQLVEASHFNIQHAIDKVKGEIYFRDRVLEKYRNIGITINEDKANAMRKLSGSFDKKEMKKVFNVIVNWG